MRENHVSDMNSDKKYVAVGNQPWIVPTASSLPPGGGPSCHGSTATPLARGVAAGNRLRPFLQTHQVRKYGRYARGLGPLTHRHVSNVENKRVCQSCQTTRGTSPPQFGQPPSRATARPLQPGKSAAVRPAGGTPGPRCRVLPGPILLALACFFGLRTNLYRQKFRPRQSSRQTLPIVTNVPGRTIAPPLAVAATDCPGCVMI
jgi:hypothetical protein